MISSGVSDAGDADAVDTNVSQPKLVSKTMGERRLVAKGYVGSFITAVRRGVAVSYSILRHQKTLKMF